MNLSIYGNQSDVLTTSRGAEIAVQQAGDLDLMAMDFTRNRSSPFALDVGCGAGDQAVRLAQEGASVLATDIVDMSQAVAAAVAKAPDLRGTVSFNRLDMRNLDALLLASFADIIVCQRAIHYCSFYEAIDVIASFKQALKRDGRLYLSACGMESELGQSYPGTTVALDHRHERLDAAMRVKYDIHAPVCLYREQEIIHLIFTGGLVPEKVFVCAAGNINLVAKHG